MKRDEIKSACDETFFTAFVYRVVVGGGMFRMRFARDACGRADDQSMKADLEEL
jgi:hypothetical protein